MYKIEFIRWPENELAQVVFKPGASFATLGDAFDEANAIMSFAQMEFKAEAFRITECGEVILDIGRPLILSRSGIRHAVINLEARA